MVGLIEAIVMGTSIDDLPKEKVKEILYYAEMLLEKEVDCKKANRLYNIKMNLLRKLNHLNV